MTDKPKTEAPSIRLQYFFVGVSVGAALSYLLAVALL